MPNDIFTTASWKKTAQGTPISIWASAPMERLRGQNPILLMGGIHGDEPEGVRLAEDTLVWLKGRASSDTDYSGDRACAPWILIPCLNVDGIARKSRVNSRGVDLNRNYPSKDWSAVTTLGSTTDASRYFPGPSAGSEPEIQGVVELIEKYEPRLIVHCHSWKPCIVGTGAAAKLDSERLAQSSGYELVEDIGYPTPGSLGSYGWHDKQIPVICIEEQDGLKDLAQIWPRFRKGMTAIFEDLSYRRGSP